MTRSSRYVDVIIPARNEQKTIANVLGPLTHHPRIGRIIVAIDPETTDETEYVVDAYSLRTGLCVAHAPESGKGQVVKFALQMYADSNRVMFCDADITGLTYEHITAITESTNSQVIGVPDLPSNYPITVHTFTAYPWVSGQRCVPLDIVWDLNLHGYLMEVQINEAIKEAKLGTDLVLCKGLISPFNMTEKRRTEMLRDRDWGLKEGILKA